MNNSTRFFSAIICVFNLRTFAWNLFSDLFLADLRWFFLCVHLRFQSAPICVKYFSDFFSLIPADFLRPSAPICVNYFSWIFSRRLTPIYFSLITLIFRTSLCFYLRISAFNICAYLRELFFFWIFLSPIYADFFSASICVRCIFSFLLIFILVI